VTMHSIREWGCAVLLGVVPILLGCGTGVPSSPDEFRAPWDSLQLLSSMAADTLTILGDGTIEYRADTLATSGLIAAGTQRALEAAWEGAQLAPWDPAAPSGAGGTLLSTRGTELCGFSWETEAQLGEAQRRLVLLLDGLRSHARSEALGEGSELVAEWIYTAVVLCGTDARIDRQTATVIRDADALLLVMQEWLGSGPVVLPEVDFDSEMLLAVCAGEQPAGTEVHVEVLASRTMTGYLRVPVTLYQPAQGCAAAGRASPYEIVRLRKLDLEVFSPWIVDTVGCQGGG